MQFKNDFVAIITKFGRLPIKSVRQGLEILTMYEEQKSELKLQIEANQMNAKVIQEQKLVSQKLQQDLLNNQTELQSKDEQNIAL